EAFVQSDDDIPPVPPYLVHLKAGTTLIMPPGTIHFVLTDGEDEPTACTGFKAWDMRVLHEIPRAILFERSHPSVTNEDTPHEVYGKLTLAGEYWVQGSTAYEFPSDDKYVGFERDMQMLRDYE